MSSTRSDRRRGRLLAALAAALVPLALAAPAAQAAPQTAQARLASVARSTPKRSVVAIVRFKPGVSERRARGIARRNGARVTEALPLIHGLALRVPARRAHHLVRVRGVASVTLNGRVKGQGIATASLVSAYPREVSADNVWNGPGGLTGKGIGVAVIDSGIAGDLPDFKAADGSSRVVANVVTNPLATTAGDLYGHGTHVAGIVAGNGDNRPASDPLDGDYVGIAPEANIVAVKAGDDTGNATVLDVINGLQFVVDHKADYNIRVVNLSLSSDTPGSYKTDPLDAAAESAWLHGIVVVAAAGNRGSAADAVSYAPANDPYVITVGATNGSPDLLADTVASWSSTGTTQDGFAKPDVVAPGSHIVSTLAPGSAFQTLCPACVVGGAYIRAGGTSMAAPVVAGAAALLLQAHPSWVPDQVKGALSNTDHAIGGTNGGLIDIPRAKDAKTTQQRANVGLTPASIVDPTTGDIDYSRSSWSRSSWSSAPGSLSAGWARSSWSCACGGSGAAIDPTRSSWSRSSWSSGVDL